MKFLDLPAWLYFPFKLLLLVSFLVPVLMWGCQMQRISEVQDTALAKTELQKNDLQAEIAQQDLDQVGDGLEPQARVASGLVEKKGEPMLARGEREVQAKTIAQSEGPAGRTESAKGIHVSYYQGVVRWDRVAKAGVQFAYAKATGGEDFVDPRFQENWHALRAVDIYRGAYHFYYAAEDPRTQAMHFVSTIHNLRPTDLPPMLDVEISDHTDKKTLLEGTLIWLETVEKTLGRRPLLYTTRGFGDQVLTDSRLSKYPLWIADYARQVGSVPSPWNTSWWTFWHHSQTGTVPGVVGDVNVNVFNGTLDDLKSFIADSGME